MQVEKIFEAVRYNCDGEYVDFSIIDNCRNGVRRHWIMTFDRANQSWCGMLQRAEDAEADFENGIYLPRRFVEKLIPLVLPHI